MPRRSILSVSERTSLLALPDSADDLIRHYTFSEADLSVIRQHRGAANRLGFAVQLCYMRFPGRMMDVGEVPFPPLLGWVGSQLKVPVDAWADYGQRAETRREHMLKLQSVFGFQPFTMQHYRPAVKSLEDLAGQTDKGMVLAEALIAFLRSGAILLPSINVIERICAEAITHGNRRIHCTLTEVLSASHRHALDELLKLRAGSALTTMAWVRQSPAAPNARHLLEHLARLRMLQALEMPDGIERQVHQNRLLKIAREGAQMSAQDLARLEPDRRYATLVAIVLEARATLIDEIIDVHDRIIGTLFNRARRNHEAQFQQSGKAINDKVRLFYRIGQALLEARHNDGDPFKAIEAIIPWEMFTKSVTEAEKLARPEDFDYLHRIGTSYSQIRRYAPAFLEALPMSVAYEGSPGGTRPSRRSRCAEDAERRPHP